jgi:hypothetical protein
MALAAGLPSEPKQEHHDMAPPSTQPEGIPKPLTPSDSPATDPLDQGDGVPAAQPRPAASASAEARTASGGRSPAAQREIGLPERQPSDATPPAEDEGPLESLGKAVSASVRDAAGSSAAGGEGKPR